MPPYTPRANISTVTPSTSSSNTYRACGIISGGKVMHGFVGMAGELGHMTVVPEGNPCACGNTGCLEKHASATAVVAMARMLGLGERITSKEVYDRAMAGDAKARVCFERMGWALGVAQWMATNLVRAGDAFVWRLDLDVMEQLLRSFFTTDLWPIVEHPAPGHIVHFVKASQSSAMSDDAVRRAESLPRHRVVVHHLDGGHWIHAESPQAIVDLLAQGLA